MSTNLEQSKWLEQMVRGIEQACTHCAGRGWIPIFETNGITSSARNDACTFCKGSRIFRSYAETGLAGWLRDKRGSEWPSLVWAGGGQAAFSFRVDWWRTQYDVKSHLEYYHALDYLDALTLLEEAGWHWWHYEQAGVWLYAAKRDVDKVRLSATSPGELLDKIREMVEKKP